MWSDHLKVAGTADLIADYNGELAVIDWKTGSYVKKTNMFFIIFCKVQHIVICWPKCINWFQRKL